MVTMNRKQILILCTGNSARSQMAEGLLRHDAGDRFEVASAGTKPSSVRPEAIAVMRELGIDISGHRSKHVDEFRDRTFDYVLTVCDDAKESCPIYPGQVNGLHQSFADSANLEVPEGDRLSAFRTVRDQIREYLSGFPNRNSDSRSRILKHRLGGTRPFLDAMSQAAVDREGTVPCGRAVIRHDADRSRPGELTRAYSVFGNV
jgi:arsenate reductase